MSLVKYIGIVMSMKISLNNQWLFTALLSTFDGYSMYETRTKRTNFVEIYMSLSYVKHRWFYFYDRWRSKKPTCQDRIVEWLLFIYASMSIQSDVSLLRQMSRWIQSIESCRKYKKIHRRQTNVLYVCVCVCVCVSCLSTGCHRFHCCIVVFLRTIR
jgi:hypothetical protein